MSPSNSNLIISYWRAGKDTQQISDLLNLREWQVYRFLARHREKNRAERQEKAA